MEPSQRTRRWHPGEWAGLTLLITPIVTQKADCEVQLYHVLLSLFCPVGQKIFNTQHMTSVVMG